MSINLPITIKTFRESEDPRALYVAYIPEFDLSSCAKTESKAKKNVKQALELMLEEIKEKSLKIIYFSKIRQSILPLASNLSLNPFLPPSPKFA